MGQGQRLRTLASAMTKAVFLLLWAMKSGFWGGGGSALTLVIKAFDFFFPAEPEDRRDRDRGVG